MKSEAMQGKLFKGSGIFMLTAIVLLLLYYMVFRAVNYKQNSNRTPDQKNMTGISDSNLSVSFSDTVGVRILTGKFSPEKEQGFDEVDIEYASRKGIYLNIEAYKAFIKMFYAAQKDGIKLTIISGTRNFNYQKSIWEAKWNGSRLVDGKNLAVTVSDPVERAGIILKYSSMPGTSRHHWGTDIDLNSLDNQYFETSAGKKVYEWLRENASGFGYCQPYTPGRSSGYAEEKWHWSYIPLAGGYLTEYVKNINYSHISGFSGSNTAEKIDVINNYVIAIDSSCKKQFKN